MNKEIKKNFQKFLIFMKNFYKLSKWRNFKMSVEDDLLKIKEIKKSLNTVIRAKGSDIADDTKFDQYPVKIEKISSGVFCRYTIDENGVANCIQSYPDDAFDSIKKIGDSAMRSAFIDLQYSPGTPKIFRNLTEIGNSGLRQAWYTANNIGLIKFPKLQKIGSYGLESTFYMTSDVVLSSEFMPELVEIADFGMSMCFENCRGIFSYNGETELSFPKLTIIGPNGMYSCFQTYSDTDFKKFLFPALTTVDSTAFGDAFAFRDPIEIHFPAAIQSTIEACTGYSDKFGNSSNTIIFDL